MSQDAKDRTCAALAGKTIKSVRWEPADGGGGYYVMTFSDDSEICWNRMQAEVPPTIVELFRVPTPGSGGGGSGGGLVILSTSSNIAMTTLQSAEPMVMGGEPPMVMGGEPPSIVAKYRDNRIFEAAQWWDTDENREMFSRWFDEHDEVFSTLGHTVVLPDGEQAKESDWIMLWPNGEFFAVPAEEFAGWAEPETQDDHPSDEREFSGESPELIQLRHAAHEFSEAGSSRLFGTSRTAS